MQTEPSSNGMKKKNKVSQVNIKQQQQNLLLMKLIATNDDVFDFAIFFPLFWKNRPHI